MRPKLVPSAWVVCGVLLLLTVGFVGADEEPAAGPVWTASASGLEVTGVSSLCMHPKRPDRLMAHVHGVGVAESFDEGKTWQALHKGLDPKHVPTRGSDPVHISLDPRDPAVVWLAVKGYVYRSADGGQSWESRSSGALRSYTWDKREGDYRIAGVVVDPKNSRRVLAGTWTGGTMRGGLFESMDGGKTWDQIAGNDLEKSELGHDAWPIVLDPRTDKHIAVGGSNGFWYSDDRGRKFKRVDPGEIGRHDVRLMTQVVGKRKDIFAADGRALWRSKDGGKRWDKKPVLEGDVIAASGSPWVRTRLYAVLRDRGLLISDDARNQKWTEIGNPELDIREILVHPREKTVVYFASPTSGLTVSRDEGTTLERVKGNVKPTVPCLRGVAHHPEEQGRVLTLTEQGIVFSSTDGGTTWERAGWLGMEPTGIRPDVTAAGAWYAFGSQLLHSADNGATWKTVWRPEDPEERLMDFGRLEDGMWYVLLERGNRVATSKDGRSWALKKGPTKAADVWARAVAIDRVNPRHMLLATRNLAPLWTPKEKDGGVYETWDGGSSWKPLVEGLAVDKKLRPGWNRGRAVAIDAGAGLQYYAADGLGLFVRRIVSPKSKPKIDPTWIDLGLPIPKARVLAWSLRPGEGETPSVLVVQVEGENDTRVLVRTTGDRVLARIVADEEGTPPDPQAPPLWDTLPAPGVPLYCLGPDPDVDGRYAACDGSGVKGVLVFGVPGERRAEEPVVPVAPPRKGAMPPEGLLAFTAGADGSVRIWDLYSGEVVGSLRGHTDEVLAVALAPDESVLATGSLDRSLRLWDAVDGSAKATLGADVTEGGVNAICFSADAERLYAGLDQSWAILEWDLANDTQRRFEGHTGGVVSLAVSRDGTGLASGSRDRTIRLWDLASGKSDVRLDFGAEVLSLAFSPDGKRLYAGGRGPSVKVYDVTEKKEILSVELQATYVADLAVSPDGAVLYTAGDRGLIAVSTTDLTPIEKPADGRYGGPTKGMFSVAVSADGTWIVGGDMLNGLWLWQRDEAEPRWHSPSAHAGAIHAVALTPDVGASPLVPEEPADAPDGG